mgnify:CR=1 FL=1
MKTLLKNARLYTPEGAIIGYAKPDEMLKLVKKYAHCG